IQIPAFRWRAGMVTIMTSARMLNVPAFGKMDWKKGLLSMLDLTQTFSLMRWSPMVLFPPVATFSIDTLWHVAVPLLAAISAIVAAAGALIDTDFKRIIAYSTISQIGFIFFGLAIGNSVGFAGGLLYILMHGLAKAGLFLCAGIVEQKTHTKDITKLGGLIKTMPLTAASFLFCAVSVMGIPPFGGFFSKYLVFMGGVQSGHMLMTSLLLVCAFLTIIYLFRLYKMIFLGEMKIEAKENFGVMVFSVMLLAALSLAGGIFVSYPMRFIEAIVK
ncbi:MAG: hypothetical protein HQL28_06775, partial [Candidatus Omnitrophica bacterium]|nr:hypothetical protein [Candidatus Omnitrophota bacterium]